MTELHLFGWIVSLRADVCLWYQCKHLTVSFVCVIQVKISCQAKQYDVSVNGQKTHTYKHRFTTLDEIDVVDVFGDLQLFSVQAKDP